MDTMSEIAPSSKSPMSRRLFEAYRESGVLLLEQFAVVEKRRDDRRHLLALLDRKVRKHPDAAGTVRFHRRDDAAAQPEFVSEPHQREAGLLLRVRIHRAHSPLIGAKPRVSMVDLRGEV